ncbi:MAG: hypothetical protein UHH95_03585 [Oscillospiraceae bacterium]|nr:hypothetical protein [Oscillospiraceae bacterium]
MIKKSIVFTVILGLLISLSVSCKQKEKPLVSSDPISSAVTSSEQIEADSQLGWGDPLDPVKMLRPSFLSVGKNGDIFYCDNEGSIYRQLAESNGLSKIYSSSKYDFVSVEVLSDTLICAGYVNSSDDSGYIIFNLKEKTVTSAVWGDDFKGKNIYSLVHFNDSVYFLSNPDRYGRYTLYRQTKDKTQQLAVGVNEFFILRSRLFYNVGGYIFSINPDGSDLKIICDVVTNDFLGFTITESSLFYMSNENTYHTQTYSSGYRKYAERIKVYTSATSQRHAFFCGVDGGIYAFSLITDALTKVSDYTADEIVCIGDYLYLKPADPLDYPELEKDFIIQNDIYRFKISDLVGEASNESADTSSSIAASELTSSLMAEIEAPIPVPERFGM